MPEKKPKQPKPTSCGPGQVYWSEDIQQRWFDLMAPTPGGHRPVAGGCVENWLVKARVAELQREIKRYTWRRGYGRTVGALRRLLKDIRGSK